MKIYTANIGGYDHPRTDIITITNQNQYNNPSRNARMCKILSHQFVDSDISVWVDANIFLRAPLTDVISEWLGDADIALFKHPIRNCVYDEVQAIKDLKRINDVAELKILEEQKEYYQQIGFPKQCGFLAETGIIIRRHNEKVINFNESWWSEVSRWSYRDQVSFPIIFNKFKHELNIKFIDGDMRNHRFVHMRPHAPNFKKSIDNAPKEPAVISQEPPKETVVEQVKKTSHPVPKITIITPTHNPKYLKDLENSLMAQRFTDWEWVVLLNNGAKYESIDSRIKIYTSKQETAFVGALKKEACSLARGEIILEVDHDDFIADNCLQEVANAFEDSEIGFTYSRTIQLDKNFKPYNRLLGWTYTKVVHEGEELFCMNNLPLYPANVGFIWFTPNHLRAWRKSIYDEIGGHNEELEICDDQDLICRLYLNTRFKEIPKPLYFYRVTGENTWLVKNKEIQTKTVELYNQYIHDLSDRYCELTNTNKLNICRTLEDGALEGYMNIPIDEFMEKDLPNESFGFINAESVLQYLEDKNEAMLKIHNLLIKGGLTIIEVPNALSQAGVMNPNNKSQWVKNSFWYYMDIAPQRERYQDKKYQNISFKNKRLYTHFNTKWHQANDVGSIICHFEK
jgi:O-antigen biosynthesis protein